MSDKLKTFLLWLAVLPVFAVMHVIAYFIIYFSSRFWGDEHSWAVDYFTPMLGSFVSGLASIIYAAKVAPYYKRFVALVLFVLMAIVTIGLIYFDYTRGQYFYMFCIALSTVGYYIGYQVAKMDELVV